MNRLLLNLIFYIPLILAIFSLEAQENLVQQANQQYAQAIQASHFQERKNAFNQALHLYLKIEQEEGSSPQLNQAIADTYFQLGEYAWSILYNERAKEEDPQNLLIQTHLSLAQNKLGISPIKESSFENFLLSSYFSLDQRMYLFLFCALFFLVVLTTFIWKPCYLFKILSFVAASLTLYGFLNLIISLYIAPIYAILITSTSLYRAPDFEEPQLSTLPILAGNKVEVIESVQNGNWLKVIDHQGQVGYLPHQTIRLITK
jgi:tetratricopeptide (TPR) repeat protein